MVLLWWIRGGICVQGVMFRCNACEKDIQVCEMRQEGNVQEAARRYIYCCGIKVLRRGHEDVRTRGQPALPSTSIRLVVISNTSEQWYWGHRSEQAISSNQYACDCTVGADSSPGGAVRGQPAHSKAVSGVGQPGERGYANIAPLRRCNGV